MGKRTIVLLTDDITGEETENVISYSFKLPQLDEDGDITYNRVSFDAEPETMARFMADLYKGVQSKYLSKSPVVVKPVNSGEGSGTDSEASDMREFAKSRNLKVADRGRVSQDIRDAYYKAVEAGDWPPFGSKSTEDSTENDDK